MIFIVFKIPKSLVCWPEPTNEGHWSEDNNVEKGQTKLHECISIVNHEN